jgi:hypothetical protein
MRRLLLLLFLNVACAAAPPPVAVAPSSPAPEPAPAPAESPAEKPRSNAVVPAAVPPPPAACTELVTHPVSCSGKAPLRAALAEALLEDDASARDAALACLEAREDAPPGALRALRAELGPEQCADALVTPTLQSPPKGLTPELEQTFFGLLVAGRLARLLADPPALEPPLTKERFRTYFVERLSPWVLAEAAAIEKLSQDGARLVGYGRGIAALAAGNADLRFVDMVRAVPLPDEMRADKRVTDAYYGELDQALEPRKVRGRDAALVGLHAFTELGALADARVDRARTLLNTLWAGSRIDSLDRLLLPPLAPPETGTPELVLAARLPTFYAKLLLADVDPTDPKLLRALLERGVPAALRAKLDVATLSPATRLLYARALVDGGRHFFRAADFKAARALLTGQKTDDAGALLAALAQALENGPNDATELLLKGPFVRGTGDVRGLDAEAKRRGHYAGYAAFDAAAVLELAPKQDDPAFWDDLATRFTKAEKLLAAAPLANAASAAASAREHAAAARATAVALRIQH